MATFSENDADRLDWELMQDGAITLCFQMAGLEQDLSWLREHGYRILTIDGQDLPAFCRQISTLSSSRNSSVTKTGRVTLMR